MPRARGSGGSSAAGVELAEDHAAWRRRTCRRRRPAAAADVEQRHRHEVRPSPASNSHISVGHREQAEEVVVGEHHALGPPGRAARVELEGDVVGAARRVRIASARGRRPTRRSRWCSACPPMTRIVGPSSSSSAMASSTGTKSGPTTNTLASASLTMYSTSGGASRQLTSTHTALSERRAEERPRSARCRSCRGRRPGPGTRRPRRPARRPPGAPARTARPTSSCDRRAPAQGVRLDSAVHPHDVRHVGDLHARDRSQPAGRRRERRVGRG